MKNYCHIIKKTIDEILLRKYRELTKDSLEKIIVEPVKDKTFGDIATNAALVLSKVLKKNPKDLADKLSVSFNSIGSVTVAGPGFLNFTMDKSFWREHLKSILLDNPSFFECKLSESNCPNQPKDELEKKKINIEFVSANPTGPLHAGHARGAVLGDVIARIFKYFGNDVTREYYINDAGAQVDALAESLFLRYKEALGQKITKDDFLGDMYHGEYIVPIAHEIAKKDGDKWLLSNDYKEFFKKYALDVFMENIKKDLAALGISMDLYTSENEIINSQCLEDSFKALKSLGLIYEGTLEAPKGCESDNEEKSNQTIFKSTEFGDDSDRSLKKSDGSWTYFAGDVAYHFDKIKRDFDLYIDIFGADHIGYIKRIESAFKALSKNESDKKLIVLSSQLVNFIKDKEAVRMSKRAGTFITLKEVIEKTSKDAVRYMMIERHRDVAIDFDFEKVLDQSKDNPIFYIQYACARINSIIRHAKSLYPNLIINDESLNLIKHREDILIIQKIADFERQVEIAYKSLEPHRIANYLYELASNFHSLWNLGDLELRFIHPKDELLTSSRLALVQGVWVILYIGLNLLGITPKEEM